MNFAFLISILLFASCATREIEDPHPSGLEITEIKPNRDSHIMKQNVLQLAQVYDLSPFLYTKRIQIKTDAIPQSHPVLTLNIRYTNYPHKILAVLLHEQFHWWALNNKKKMDIAVVELKKMFPRQHPSVYQHFLICYLEHQAVRYYVGDKIATSIIYDFIRRDKIRPWIYSQVLLKHKIFKKIFTRYKLIPKPLA
jgi:hypothetical protein